MQVLIRKNLFNKGFSLVEMAVVLGIVGLVAVGSIGLYSEQHSNSLQKGSEAKLAVVKKALLEFALVNKYMPCPDSTGAGIDDRTALVGTIPAIAAVAAVNGVAETLTDPAMPPIAQVNAQAAIPNVGVNVCTVNDGIVPYAAIGLSPADVQDSSGNFFRYAVDQGVTVANNMLDCPNDTACFFNGDPEPALPAGSVLPGTVLPAFDLTTAPQMGALGANNLRICGDVACANIEADGLVAVLMALNANGGGATASNEEAENTDNDATFVNMPFSDVYDDQLLGIAGNEIKTRSEEEAVEIVTSTGGGGPITQTGNDLQNMGDTSVGGIGTNIGTDQAMLDLRSQSFDFGTEAANKQIVLSFDTHAVGGWNQPGTTHSGVWSDRASVTANGSQLHDFRYDHLVDKNAASGFVGFEQVTFESAITGRYSDIYTSGGSWDSQWVTLGQQVTTWAPAWDASHEYIVTADANGIVSVDFAVQTTATVETIDFTNIELVFYDTPPEVPNFPTTYNPTTAINPVSGNDISGGIN